ncbi:MAG TPA: hypothetical protein VN253_04805, partial [Kofleriaceae bacterium]|nr:hypothetical protein [Kofleriaceae bacterium]
MLAGIIVLAVAAIGGAYAVLILRAAPHRRDNLTFGKLALLDAAITAWRGLNVLAGDSLADMAYALPCALGTIGLALLTIEFISAFPRRPSITWRCRIPMVLWAAGAVALAVLETRGIIRVPVVEWAFFMPVTFVIFAIGARAWRRTTDRAAHTVIAMLWLRWGFGFVAFKIARPLGVFEEAIWFETTVTTLVSFVGIGTAVLRSELFSLRSSMAEVMTIAAVALVVVLGGGAAVWAVQRYTAPGSLQHALLVGATLVPLSLAAIGYALYPRVERQVL